VERRNQETETESERERERERERESLESQSVGLPGAAWTHREQPARLERLAPFAPWQGEIVA